MHSFYYFADNKLVSSVFFCFPRCNLIRSLPLSRPRHQAFPKLRIKLMQLRLGVRNQGRYFDLLSRTLVRAPSISGAIKFRSSNLVMLQLLR